MDIFSSCTIKIMIDLLQYLSPNGQAQENEDKEYIRGYYTGSIHTHGVKCCCCACLVTCTLHRLPASETRPLSVVRLPDVIWHSPTA
eukprot:1050063-Pyramimonas_sp.AAC.1